jgi:hypothetical protein
MTMTLRRAKYIEILILLGLFSIAMISLKLALGSGPELHLGDNWPQQEPTKANGLSLEYNETIKAVNYFTASLVLSCSILFDTGEVNVKQSYLCQDIMQVIDTWCASYSEEFCFGDAWSNYKKYKHKNPDWCFTILKGERLDC